MDVKLTYQIFKWSVVYLFKKLKDDIGKLFKVSASNSILT